MGVGCLAVWWRVRGFRRVVEVWLCRRIVEVWFCRRVVELALAYIYTLRERELSSSEISLALILTVKGSFLEAVMMGVIGPMWLDFS